MSQLTRGQEVVFVNNNGTQEAWVFRDERYLGNIENVPQDLGSPVRRKEYMESEAAKYELVAVATNPCSFFLYSKPRVV